MARKPEELPQPVKWTIRRAAKKAVWVGEVEEDGLMRAHDVWLDAQYDLFRTMPTTEKGLLAFIDYLLSHAGADDIEFDHIIPWEISHDSSLGNCQVLCTDCHEAKTAAVVSASGPNAPGPMNERNGMARSLSFFRRERNRLSAIGAQQVVADDANTYAQPISVASRFGQ